MNRYTRIHNYADWLKLVGDEINLITSAPPQRGGMITTAERFISSEAAFATEPLFLFNFAPQRAAHLIMGVDILLIADPTAPDALQ